MNWLVIDADGTLAAILSAHPGAMETRRVVEAEVPADYPEIADWEAATETFVPSVAKAEARLRVERDERLRACDWTQLPDVDEAVRLAWQPYRQALRDLPDTTTDPFAPAWPAPPA
jgi:hypothetical protein